ncbi:MAG: hypothetical protein QF531_00620, partial [Candidatus Poseidonia sp.]|nr:hypothetical protein [Poseidonia sp.]
IVQDVNSARSLPEVLSIIVTKVQAAMKAEVCSIYLFDETFWHRFDNAVQERGSAFSISDVNRSYVQDGQASILTTDASAWIDCGTPETLLKAAIAAEQGILNPYSNQE